MRCFLIIVWVLFLDMVRRTEGKYLKDNRHKRRLESRKQRAGLRVKEEFLYVCGSTLFPGGDMQDKILVKESLHCGSPIETTYYSGIYSDFSQNYNVYSTKKETKHIFSSDNLLSFQGNPRFSTIFVSMVETLRSPGIGKFGN